MSDKSSTKSVLITGASSGIGFATAEYFTDKGWRVFGLSRSGSVSEGVFSLIADINKPEELKKSFEIIWQETGRLDAVVHSAGIGGAGPIESFPIDEAHKVINTNLFGSLNVAQACLPYLRQQPKSHFIFISSIAGLMGVPFHGIYSASKFATEGMVECLRQELTGSGVNVVSLCPGDTKTPIIGHQFRIDKERLPLFYRNNYDKTDLKMRTSVADGISASEVAASIYKITQKASPRIRYSVGVPLQQLSPYIKRVLPSRLFEIIMKNYYGLK